MIGQVVLRVVTQMTIPLILVYGFYVIAHGETGPGGGFQGGVILASAYILYVLIYGLEAGQRVIPQGWLDTLMGVGILIYAGVGVLGMLQAGAFLDYSYLDPSDPTHAEPLGMTLVEWGVGITVASVMMTIFNTIAGREEINAS